jgi:peptidoglycan L-alanyl-D-glutamate endopeptidase CwlK
VLLNDRSKKKLEGVHVDLVRVVGHAVELATAAGVYFIVTEGLRSVERQRQLVAAGASTTMRSRHLTGHAVDLAAVVSGEVRWDWPLYHRLGELVKQAAQDLQVPIEWGGDWKAFKDGPHFQLPWREYPEAA